MTLRERIEAELDRREQIVSHANQAYPYAPGAEPPAEGVHWRWVAGENWKTVNLDAAEEFVAEPGYPCWLATVEEWANDRGRQMPRTYMYEAVEVDLHAARHIALHDPADARRRYAAARRVLERHQPTTIGGAPLMAGEECACYAPWPCDDVRDLADSLGIDLGAQT